MGSDPIIAKIGSDPFVASGGLATVPRPGCALSANVPK